MKKFLKFLNDSCQEHPWITGLCVFVVCMLMAAAFDLLANDSPMKLLWANVFISGYGSTLIVLMQRQIHSNTPQDPDLFEDFTELRWVKWSKRKPTFNGSVLIRYNGKNMGLGTVNDGELLRIEGTPVDSFDDLDDVYWLEETIDTDGFNEVREFNSAYIKARA